MKGDEKQMTGTDAGTDDIFCIHLSAFLSTKKSIEICF